MKFSLKKLALLCVIFELVDFCEMVQTKMSKTIGHGPPSIFNRPVFTVVRFLNIPCSSVNGQLTGTCFALNDCLRMQGTQIGTCASGFGVCCVFQRSCGVATAQNSTHFISPGYPQDITESEDTTCTLTLLRPLKLPICQIRLDFLDFDITRPTDGSCMDDKFSVIGSNINAPVPTICGRNTGQHMYIDIENTIGPIYLTVNTKGAGTRKWNIRASFIECTNPSKAPPNCLQYYTGVEGRFSSFNYETGETAVFAGGYLSNMNYAICFRKEIGRCSITYTADNIESFIILNLNSDTNSPTVGAGEAGLGIEECPMDYLRLGDNIYCGARLNPSTFQPNPNSSAPVTDDSSGPFIAHFRTDSTDNGAGFNLKYNQNAC